MPLTEAQHASGRAWSKWLRGRPSFPEEHIKRVANTLKLVAHVYDPEAGDVGPAAFAHFAYHRAGVDAVAGLPLDEPARVAFRKAAAVAALLAGHAASGLTQADAALVVEAVWAGIPKPAAATACNAPPAPPAAPLPPAAAQAATPVAQPVEAAGNPATTQCGWCCGACKLSLASRSWVQELFVSASNETETLTCGDCYAARPRPERADEALAWTAHMGPADARTALPLVALALAPAIYATAEYTAKAEAARRALEEESANYMNFATEFQGRSDLNGKRYLLRFLRRRPDDRLRFSEWTPQWIRDARKAKRMGERPSRGWALLRGVSACA